MFVLLFAVPALLVVVAGYAVGYAVAEWAYSLAGAEPARTPEVAGWTTGLALLAVVVWLLLSRWRRRGKAGDREKDRHQKDRHQK